MKRLASLCLLIASSCSVPTRPSAEPERAPLPEPSASSTADVGALARARDLLAQARAARADKEPDRARELTASGIESLLASAGAEDAEAVERTLLDLGALARESGDLRAARAAGEALVERRQARLESDHPDLAATRAILAGTLRALGELAEARALQEQVLAALERTLPTEHADVNAARSSLAYTLREQGELALAHELEVHVLAEYERTLPPDHPLLESARENLAITLASAGDLMSARELFERVLAARERSLAEDDLEIAKVRANLAVVLFMLGDLPGARRLQEQALVVCERSLPPGHPTLSSARANLASTIATLGDLPAARALEEQVLAQCERDLPADHPDLNGARANLALTLRELGDLTAARALQEQVWAVCQRSLPPGHPDMTMAQANLATTLREMGQFADARSFQEQVFAEYQRSLPPDHPTVSRARDSLAATLFFLQDLPAARALFEQTNAVYERSLPPEHPDRIASWERLAGVLYAMGELKPARASYERVLAARERTLPPDHPQLSVARENLVYTLGALLELGEADETASDLTAMALEFAGGLRRVVQGILLQGSPREVEQRIASREGSLGSVLSLALGLGIADVDPALVRDAFLLIESSRSGGLIAAHLAAGAGHDPVALSLRDRIGIATDELARLAQSGGGEEEISGARMELDQAGHELALHAGELLGRWAPLEPTIEALVHGLGPRDALVSYRRANIQRLRRGAALAWEGTDSLIAFVLRPAAEEGETGARLVLVDLGAVAPIESAIDAWRKSVGLPLERGVAGVNRAAGLAAAGDEVRRLVLDPLKTPLQGVERVIVTLDDSLHTLPLDALPVDETWGGAKDAGQTVGDVLRIDVRSSLIELLLEVDPPEGAPALLAIGHPAFDQDPAGPEKRLSQDAAILAAAQRTGEANPLSRGTAWERGFGTLPETQTEVRGIAQYFADAFGEDAASVVLERTNASREALIELGPRARWLHVATHGWFAPESVRSSADPESNASSAAGVLHMDADERTRGMSPMLLCGLALAGANLPTNSVGRIPGLVTAQEIAALDLSNCELAVLSACDTNVGVRRAGQGVASLQKALHMAGARSVITSLWKVPDEATKELMIDFYRRLWLEKKPKHQALREAKKRLRDARDERGNPRYAERDWAAWVLTGNPN